MALLNEQANEALRVVGGYRRWHLCMYLALATSLSMALCWQNISFVFIGWEPEHHCQVPSGYHVNLAIPMESAEGGTQSLSRCSEFVNRSLGNDTRECSNGWTYDTEGEETIVTEWDLVCSKTFFSELSQVLYPVGATIGEIIATYLMDRFGRKWIHIAGHLGVAIIGCAMAVTQTYLAFLILRAIIGGFVMATLHSGISLIMEMWDADRRSTVGVALQLAWSAIYVSLAALVYYIRNWRHLQATLSACSAVWIIYIWLLPESVMWLVANGRLGDAEQLLNKMARWNGVKGTKISLQEPDEPEVKNEVAQAHVTVSNQEKSATPPRIKDLFLDGKLRIHFVIGSLLLFANVLVYYGLILSTPALAGSRYLNFLLGGVVEIPGYIVTVFVVRRFGRRVPLCVFHMVAGAPLAIIAFLPQQTATGTDLGALHVAAALVGKFGITITFAIAVMYLREIFPTNLRGISIGLCNILATGGMMLAPYAGYLAKRTPWVPNVVFAFISVLVGALVLVMPETRDLALPQTVSDIHSMWKKKGPGKKSTGMRIAPKKWCHALCRE